VPGPRSGRDPCPARGRPCSRQPASRQPRADAGVMRIVRIHGPAERAARPRERPLHRFPLGPVGRAVSCCTDDFNQRSIVVMGRARRSTEPDAQRRARCRGKRGSSGSSSPVTCRRAACAARAATQQLGWSGGEQPAPGPWLSKETPAGGAAACCCGTIPAQLEFDQIRDFAANTGFCRRICRR
jgi:hypothetical protein